jgi:hypothetical protein
MKDKNQTNTIMEDQATYKTQNWRRWHLKQLAPLSTDLEKELCEEWQMLANDSVYTEIGWGLMSAHVNTGHKFKKLHALGYFESIFTGPGNYHAIGLHRTPYSMAILILEMDHDRLQQEAVKTEGGEG